MPPDFSPNPFYYLGNFRRALDWVEARYRDMLGAKEERFLAGFARLSQASQALLVRMLMRKGPFFRTSRLVYDEIGCPNAAAHALIAAGWIDDEPPLACDDVFALASKAELLDIVATLGGGRADRAVRKIDLLDTLRAASPEPRSWLQWRPTDSGRVFALNVTPVVERFRLMFFGNLYQDWSEFVVADLGIVRYESVPFPASSRAFQHRADVDVYLALHACRETLALLEMTDAVDEAAHDEAFAAVLASVEQCATGNAWLEARRAKLLYGIGQYVERRERWDHALDVYERSGHPGARFRRVRVLEQLERFDDALTLAAQLVAQPLNDEEHQQGTRTLARLQRRAGQRVARHTTKHRIVQEEIALWPGEPPQRVEHCALAHLAGADAPVFYVENALINSLFGLLCWRAIFAPVQGAFFNPFQRGPADLHAHDFTTRRAEAFDACLAQLDSDAYRQTILDTFAEKNGIASPFVAWRMLSPELLQLALDCLPATHLKLWFKRLLLDVRANRSGLPDLIRFWPAERRYELIEVKGPGDRLQDNQIRWLDYCIAHGLPVRVLHVRWLADADSDADSSADTNSVANAASLSGDTTIATRATA